MNPDAADRESKDGTKSEQGLDLIILDLGDNQMLHVGDYMTAHDAWYIFRRIHAEPSTSNRTRLNEMILMSRQEDGEDARAHVQDV